MMIRRYRIRARGPRGTHGLVHMVRDQVKVVAESTDRLHKDVKGLGQKVGELGRKVEELGAGVKAMGESVIVFKGEVNALGALLEDVAEAADKQEEKSEDFEKRISALEKKAHKK